MDLMQVEQKMMNRGFVLVFFIFLSFALAAQEDIKPSELAAEIRESDKDKYTLVYIDPRRVFNESD